MGESAHGKSWEFDFFVSYTHEDVKQAEWIAWVLNRAGYRVIIQKWDFTVGRNWFAAMDNASRIAERTVAVLSKAYGDSDYCRLEWQQAMELDPGGTKRKLVPIRIVPYKPDSYLRQVVYIDLVGLAEDEARERIIAGAHQAVTGEAIPATAPRSSRRGRHRVLTGRLIRRCGFPTCRSRRSGMSPAPACWMTSGAGSFPVPGAGRPWSGWSEWAAWARPRWRAR